MKKLARKPPALTATPIQWTWDLDPKTGLLIPLSGSTWNPLVGCRRVSPGCGGPKGSGSCYAERLLATRLVKLPVYQGIAEMTDLGPRFTGEHRLVADRLDAPLRARRGRKIFVCDLGDIFFEGHSFEEIAAVWGIMAAAHWHTFQVLTKRPKRALAFFAWLLEQADAFPAPRPMSREERLREYLAWRAAHALTAAGLPIPKNLLPASAWPLTNVWLGVTAEDQKRADDRLWRLLLCPAVVYFVSVEPQCEPVDLRHLRVHNLSLDGRPRTWDCLTPSVSPDAREEDGGLAAPRRVSWVIQGGWSGPGAGPFDVAWARRMRDDCKDAGVAYFLKQLGARPFKRVDHGPHDGASFDVVLRDSHGGDETEWPPDLQGCRAFPTSPAVPTRRAA